MSYRRKASWIGFFVVALATLSIGKPGEAESELSSKDLVRSYVPLCTNILIDMLGWDRYAFAI